MCLQLQEARYFKSVSASLLANSYWSVVVSSRGIGSGSEIMRSACKCFGLIDLFDMFGVWQQMLDIHV